MTLPITAKVSVGGDYNPEQWPEQVWKQDYRRSDTRVVTTFLSARVDERDNAFLADVPGPLGALMGVRIDEWDARGPEFVNPVRLGTDALGADVEVVARLLFELVTPQGAATVGTYPDRPALETATRVTPGGTRILFLLNHDSVPVEVTAAAGGTDLLSGDRICRGAPLTVGARGVLVVREDPR